MHAPHLLSNDDNSNFPKLWLQSTKGELQCGGESAHNTTVA